MTSVLAAVPSRPPRFLNRRPWRWPRSVWRALLRAHGRVAVVLALRSHDTGAVQAFTWTAIDLVNLERTRPQMKSTMKLLSPLVLMMLTVAGGIVAAETNSYFDKGYDFATLKTWDFKTQRRISTDPIADNRLWADDIRSEITKDLQSNGFERVTNGARPEFLVAFYVGLQQKYDVQYMDYGYPGFWGTRRFGWNWGWPTGDVWQVPYTDSTLIVDIIDGQTNQLIWRGYDVNTIDMKKPDKRLDKAVDGLVKKYLKDAKARG